MVQQGIVIVEAFGAEEFFMVQFAIGLSELDVSFVRNLSKRMVMHGVVCVYGKELISLQVTSKNIR